MAKKLFSECKLNLPFLHFDLIYLRWPLVVSGHVTLVTIDRRRMQLTALCMHFGSVCRNPYQWQKQKLQEIGL